MNTRLLTTLSALTLLAASCTQELTGPQEGLGEVREVEMNVSLPDASVKTALGNRTENGYPTLWSEGDMISLNGVCSTSLSAEDAGKSVASFIFKGSIMYPYNLLYPATEEASVVNFPALQQYHQGTFDPAAVPMYSASRSFENASLSHLSSLLKFSMTSAEGVTLSQVQVTSMGGEQLSGPFRMVSDGEGLFTGEMEELEGSVSTSISFGESGLKLSSEPSEFFVSIPHGTYSAGFSVLAIADDGSVMTLKFYTKDGDKEIAPAKVIEFENVEYAGEDSILLIRTIEDLMSLQNVQGDYTEAVLVSDLDFSGREWTPLADISLALNGAGHTLKALPAPLCKTLNGSVKDMTVEADINLTAGTVAAAFAEVMNGKDAYLLNCKVKGNVTLAVPSATGTAYVAGFAGQLKGGAVIENCTNNALVSVSSAVKGSANLNLAGIVATVDASSSVKSSVNEGTVMSESAALNYQYVSGCVADCKGALSDVVNEGNVTVGPIVKPTERLWVGGVVAGRTANGSLSAVVNAGTVTVAGASGNQTFVGGVIGYNNVGGLDNTMVSNTSESVLNFTVANGVKSPAVGGIVGYITAADAELSSLVNNSAVNVEFPSGYLVTNDAKVGGVAGYLYFSGVANLVCKDCVNRGAMTFTGKTLAGEKMSQGVQIGGVLGRCQVTGGDASIKALISGCTNYGDIIMNESDESKYTFVGGIIGTYSVLNTTISGCGNSGDIIKNGNSAGAVFMGGIVGSVYRDAVSTSDISGCRNDGKIALYDGGSAIEVAAGGIIGNASGISGKALTLTVSECVNEGQIDRLNTAYGSTCNSYAGGIIGIIGRRHQTTKEGYVTVTVSDCSNSAQIIFNQFQGFDTHKENSTNVSFTGGIIGCSLAENGSVEVICCNNEGRILSTSGQHGGIVGFAHSGTAVKGRRNEDGTVDYCVNSGSVCDLDGGSPQGSGYNIAGGIVGYLKTHASKKNTIEYCWNSAKVYASVSSATECTAGGIVGKHQEANVVRYCKNSGDVYNDQSTRCGAISGAKPQLTVSYCGVGGRVYRAGWVDIDGGKDNPWQNYIYDGELLNEDNTPSGAFPEEVYYNGCCFWDGTSALPWEKSDWVEPEE